MEQTGQSLGSLTSHRLLGFLMASRAPAAQFVGEGPKGVLAGSQHSGLRQGYP